MPNSGGNGMFSGAQSVREPNAGILEMVVSAEESVIGVQVSLISEQESGDR